METQINQTDVVIAGGGLSGLTAATYLARSGRTVTLFEKAPNLGGRASTQAMEGYCFNRGIHALYSGGAASQVLQELAIPYSGNSPKELFFLHEGQLHEAPFAPRALLRSQLLGSADKIELMRVVFSLARANPQTFAQVSVCDWLERQVRRPAVRQLIAAIATTFVYSTALDLVSAEVFIHKMQLSLKHPVVYMDGGWQTLVEGLRQAATQAGATILTGTRIEAIDHHNGRVQGVHLRDGRSIPARAVILALAPRDALKLVDNGDYAPLRQMVERLIPAQVACLDVALRRLPNPRYPVVTDLDRPCFMSAQSLYSQVAPAGAALIYTFKQLDPRQKSDPAEDERDLEALLDAAQPGWRDVLVKRQFLPRIDAIGMLPTAQAGGYAGRPGTHLPGISNLYLAGDWIGEGFLSDASFASARTAAHQILRT
jgi:phytoene dehydrogenase-like protein